MKSVPSSPITVLILGDADRPLRQFRISRSLAVILPAAAVLSISSLVTSMHYHAEAAMHRLESQAASVELENRLLTAQSAGKDQRLAALRAEVSDLSQECSRLRAGLERMDGLEERLGKITGAEDSSGSVRPESPGDTRPADFPATHEAPEGMAGQTPDTARQVIVRIGSFSARLPAVSAGFAAETGSYTAAYETEESRKLGEVRDDLEELRLLLDEVANRMAAAVAAGESALEQKNRTASAVWPTPSRIISSSFGTRTDPFNGTSAFHSGLDIAGNAGDPVFAALDGTVLQAEENPSRGRYLVLDHGNGLHTWYMHLSRLEVKAGAAVRRGEVIGRLGSTGRSTGPHLHFQVEKKNTPVNPLAYLDAAGP
ncbi:M23 family metallopeptidase [Paenibacillus glufosinatiresistens]|uniref:M23 family metallopeptidase n=1 Tax=Paenibacillus glufosinatiresistens TaxID=3070657 RepID=UPI00286E832F|nr:M23 family metallopeptidase [Paenibacillus sp. YX.27]